MKDLAAGLDGKSIFMLGAGNPAHVPDVEKACHAAAEQILAEKGAFEKILGDYDPPRGNKALIDAICTLMNTELGWDIAHENVALSNGSQTALFMLFNLLAGRFEGGLRKKILLPMAPEYIGYTDLGIEEDLFISYKPKIEFLDEHIFKYRVDFDSLKIDESIGAICVSRPTNPTANVLTDEEITRLDELARRNGIPLIIDNAYGLPFPNILFTEAQPFRNDNTIVCMSLSKLGLPSARFGIVTARPEITDAITEMNAVITLSPSGVGAAIGTRLIESEQIMQLSRQAIRPFYEEKCRHALQMLTENLKGLPFAVHKPEGAFFLWLWLRDLPISCGQLYQRLKKRGVVVVPGHHFYPGLDDNWPHKDQCLRISYAQETETVTTGLGIITDEIRKVYQK